MTELTPEKRERRIAILRNARYRFMRLRGLRHTTQATKHVYNLHIIECDEMLRDLNALPEDPENGI